MIQGKYSISLITSHGDLIHELIQIFGEEKQYDKLDALTTSYTEGFVDNKENFHTRSSAGEIAYQAGQLKYDNQRQYLYSYGYNRIKTNV